MTKANEFVWLGGRRLMVNWIVWALLSALFAGVTAVLAKLGVQNIDSNLATAIRTTVILVLAWTIALFRSEQTIGEVSYRTLGFLALSGIATGASWLCYFRALQLGPVTKVVPIDKLSIVFAMILAIFFLSEPFAWRQGIGAILIVAGSIVLIGAN